MSIVTSWIFLLILVVLVLDDQDGNAAWTRRGYRGETRSQAASVSTVPEIFLKQSPVGSTHKVSTGKSYDLQNSHFLFAEFTLGKSLINAPIVKEDSSNYHMFNNTQGSIQVSLRENSDRTEFGNLIRRCNVEHMFC